MIKPTLVVNNRYELRAEILKTTAEYGGQVDLNYIDVSRVTDMQSLFTTVLFNGDISKWDVSNVTNMHEMFARSPFNGDISCWDVSSVKNMDRMFSRSFFNGDISDWNVASLETCDDMFDTSKYIGQCKNIADRMAVVKKKEVDAQFEALVLRNNPLEIARERAKVQREIRRLTDELKALKEGVSVLLDTTSVNWTN